MTIMQHQSHCEIQDFFPILQEMVDWFNAIRAARFHYLQVAFPGASNSEVTHKHSFKRLG